MVGGYFASAGETEIRGLPKFLEKISSKVLWKRCFPAREKPGPKPCRSISPRREERGATGSFLARKIKERLRKMQNSLQEYCLFIVIDDADCQSPKEKDQEFEQIFNQYSIQWIGFWALPEIESWFLGDLENSFRKFSPFKEKFVLFIRDLRSQYAFSTPEDFNNILKNDGKCFQKLSEIISDIFRKYGILYKKGENSANFLRNIDPDNVAKRCPFFRNRLLQLREGIRC